MTVEEKLAHIESAQRKIREGREGWLTRLDTDLSGAEYDAIEAALEIAAGICVLFKDRA